MLISLNNLRKQSFLFDIHEKLSWFAWFKAFFLSKNAAEFKADDGPFSLFFQALTLDFIFFFLFLIIGISFFQEVDLNMFKGCA